MKSQKPIINVLLSLLVITLLSASPVYAQDTEAGQGGELKLTFGTLMVGDPRVNTIKKYLISHDSPMVDYAGYFVSEADRLGLPWNLVVAIAGTESTFGKHIPPGSYNAWGWGIPTGASSGICFSSWAEGITKVSEGLRYNYVNNGLNTVSQIGGLYAASPAWTAHVYYFMNQIASYKDLDTTTSGQIPLTL